MLELGRRMSYRGGLVTAVLTVALVVAACGSSSKSNSKASSAASAAPTTASSAPATGSVVGTAKGSLGTYLTGASGRALYIWVADSSGKSVCNGNCAATWPPLTTTATPTATGGAIAADLGTITRSDGTKQVTYKGRPLYYFVADKKAGMTTGQGSNSFGAKWWLISPSGGEVGAASRSSSGGSSGGTSGGAYGATSSSAGGSSSGGTGSSGSGGGSGGGWG